MSQDKEPLFVLVARVAEKDGAAPINKLPGCWERQIGKDWWVAVNAHKQKVACSKGAEVEPFHCYVEYMGWPAGIFTPYGGVIAAGSAGSRRHSKPNLPLSPKTRP